MTIDRQRKPLYSTVVVYLLALAGAVTGICAGPQLVVAAGNGPPWLLPAVVLSCAALGLIVGYAAVRAVGGRSGRRPGAGDGDASRRWSGRSSSLGGESGQSRGDMECR